MSLTEKQIQLVTESWQSVVPIADTAGKLFYGRLFELDPSLRPMFKGDITSQGKKLMQVLGVAVNALNNLDNIIPALEDMAQRHVAYGVKEEHYETVGQALLWTLQQGLGDACTEEVIEAWTAVYTLIANTMMEAAAETA
ncbi:globin family protein [Endozoicomonadaceae bacterium StTr2]